MLNSILSSYAQTSFPENNQPQLLTDQNNKTLKKSDIFGILKDTRDGKVYQTVIIGKQTWMAENLAYQPSSGNYWVYYDEPANLEKYGYLYDWETAKKVCPKGWHLPSDEEWQVLTDYLGGNEIAGGKMKSTGTEYWKEPNEGAVNSSGFSGLPGGLRNYGGMFYLVGYNGYWWTSTELNTKLALDRYLDHNLVMIYRFFSNKENGQSCRCLKD